MGDNKIKAGETVLHKLNGTELLVLREGNEQYLCRTQDLREIWFYKFELKINK